MSTSHTWNTVVPNPQENAPRPEAWLDRYHKTLEATPPAGAGLRWRYAYHVACRGIEAGLTMDTVDGDWQAVCGGVRPRHELRDAWRSALSKGVAPKAGGYIHRPIPKPKPHKPTLAPTQTDAFIAKARAAYPPDEAVAELWEASPYRLMDSPQHDAAALITSLYKPEDWLFIGGKIQTATKPVSAWLEQFSNARWPEYIGPNPYKPGTTRAQANVLDPRFVVLELDPPKPFEGCKDAQERNHWRARAWGEQASLLLYLMRRVAVAAVVCSGNKSLHAWIPSGATRDTWGEIYDGFSRVLIPLGADGQFRSMAQSSRIPNVTRRDEKTGDRVSSRLLYLNPEAVR